MKKNSLIPFVLFALIVTLIMTTGPSFTQMLDLDEFAFLPMVGNESVADSGPAPTSTMTPIVTSTSTAIATATSVATSEPTNTPTPDSSPTATPTATPEPVTLGESWLASWMLNETNETSSIFSGVVVNVSSVYTSTVDGKVYQCIEASGMPNYDTLVSEDLISSLNNRPRAAFEFGTGSTTLNLGDSLPFGGDVGFTPAMGCTSGEDGFGYWPPGPACPESQNKVQCFPMEPEPAMEVCETGLNDIGTWVNGVSIFNWTDGQSYNNAGVWQNEAFHFEYYDLDICPGHSANGNYHHHSNPVCLAEQLEDNGDGHSIIYGFAADGYPIYGPWQANDVLAKSCWKTRDYDDPASPTGCGTAGERSCVLVDQFDYTQGTEAAASDGPSTSDTVTSMSSNTFTATSGYYFEDYYYDAACTALGIEYLDEHNGHEHDDLGYHYHITLSDDGDGTYTDVFPFYVGPTYAGTLQDNAIASCGTGGGMGGGPPGGGGGGPPGGGGGPP